MFELAYAAAVVGIFAIILFAGIKRGITEDSKQLLGRFNDLRGIFAIEIVTGHVIRYESTVLYPMGKFLIVSVAFFFFVSSFGMVQSYRSKENYLRGFLASKCGYIFILAVVTHLVNVAISMMTGLEKGYNTTSDSLLYNFFKETNWYLWELLGFYALFFLLYKYVHKYRCAIFFLITTVGATLLFKYGWVEGYYASALAFPFGVLVGEHFKSVSHFVYGPKGYAVTAGMALGGLSCLFLGEDSLVGMVYLRNTLCLSGLIILMYFMRCFRCTNRALRVLGDYSTEIYLFQFIWLAVSEAYGWDYKVRLPFVLAATGTTAYLMHFALNPVKRYMKTLHGQ